MKQPHYPTARHRGLAKTNELRFAFVFLTLSITFSLSLAQRTDQPGVIQTTVDKQLITRLEQTIPRLMTTRGHPLVSTFAEIRNLLTGTAGVSPA